MKGKCLSPTDPNVLRINETFTSGLGLPKGVRIKGQDLVDGIKMYMAEQGIPQEHLKFYMSGHSDNADAFRKGLAQYLSQYFGMGTEIAIDDKETLNTVNAILAENKQSLNRPIEDSQEMREFAETLGNALGITVPVINLSNKQIFIPAPNIIKLGSDRAAEKTAGTSLAEAALHTFTGFPKGVTEVGYFDQDPPFVRFTHKGKNFMFTFGFKGDKLKIYLSLREEKGVPGKRKGYYYNVDHDVSLEEKQKAIDRYLPKEFVEALTKVVEAEAEEYIDAQNALDKLLREKFNVFYLNTTLLGTAYEREDENINRLKEHLKLGSGEASLSAKQQKTASVEFIESTKDYTGRNEENANWSDVTLSFAADFSTGGEKATKRYAGNKFVPVHMFFGADEEHPSVFINTGNEDREAKEILKDLKKQGLPTKNIKLNIAGNGIYSFIPGERDLTQAEFNDYVTKVITELQKLGVTIAEIRSGGQTGADEAGIIAATRLGIKATVNAPKGWKFRISPGTRGDVSDEARFKARFGVQVPAQRPTRVTQRGLDDYVKEIEGVISSFSNTIQRGKGDTAEAREKDFAKNHTYYIKDKNDKLKKVDISVTQLNEQVLGIDPYSGPETPAARIGNTFDSFVRDYFNGGVKAAYDNLSAKQAKELKRQLGLFEAALDKEFGIDEKTGKGRYKVITSEFPIGGYVTINGKKKSVAGTMDMLVVTDTGDIYIYDMKTSSHDSLSAITRKKYSGQTTFYKRILETNFPELADRIKGTGLLLAHTTYTKDYSNYTYAEEGNDVYYEGVPIYQSDADYDISIYYKSAKPSLEEAIVNVGYSDAIEELEISPLTLAEKESLEDMPGGEGMTEKEQELRDTARETTDELEGTESTLSEEISTRNTLRPVSSAEILAIGRNMVKMVSWLCDRLSEDDEWRIATGLDRIFTKENEFVGMPADEILKSASGENKFSQVWPILLNWLENTYFNLDELQRGSEMYEKVKWINDHFTDIMNTAFAELVSVEGIALTGATPEYTEEMNQLFSAEAREEDAREAYAIDSRTKSYEASMPTKLKRKLARIGDFATDENGEVLRDEETGQPIFNADKWGYGMPVFLSKSAVINHLMHTLHYYKKASEMMADLEEQAKELPWVQQVIDMLKEDPKLMTMFKVSFRKNETFYNKIYLDTSQKEQKILVSTPLNEKNKISTLMDSINAKILSEDSVPAIFTHDSKDALGVFSIDGVIYKDIRENLKILKSKADRSDKVKALKDILSDLGVEGVDNINIFRNKALAPQLQKVAESIGLIISTLDKTGNKFTFGEKLQKQYYGLAANLTVAVPNTSEISSYDNGKSYMTYTDPSFIETLLDELSGRDPYADVFGENSKYNTYRAFSYLDADGNRVYVSSWLKRMLEDPEARETLQHYVRTTTEDTPYIKQSDKQYWLSLLIDYFAPTTSKYFTNRNDLRLFRMPTMSDKPAGESVQFVAEAVIDPDDLDNNYGLDEMKDKITDASYEYFLYEINRFNRVLRQLAFGNASQDVETFNIKRGSQEAENLIDKLKDKKKKITAEDIMDERGNLLPFLKKSGASFKYLPMFNRLKTAVLDKQGKITGYTLSPMGKLLLDYLNGKSLSGAFGANLRAQFERDYKAGMEAEYAKFRRKLEQTVSSKDLQNNISVMTSKKLVDAYLQEYFWNDSLATMNIYNLTVVDPAFFKNNIDLQKRFAQVHSSTVKADVEATFQREDGTRQRFSDGFHRTLIVEDIFSNSSLAEETEKLFKSLEKEARQKGNIKQANEYKKLAKTVPDFFKGFDSTDGQAMGSPTSFWKKLNMLGEFNPDFDEAMKEIRKGNFTVKNLNLCIQPFKPFVYGHVHKEGNPELGIADELVPMQIKDSEAMIYLAGAIMQGANWNHPLRALYNFMEKTHYGYREDEDMSLDTYSPSGIDTIAFHSAVKEGAFGVLQIAGKSEEEITKELEKAFAKNTDGSIQRDSNGRPIYDENIVKVMDFECWGKQQNVPEHMRDHEQAMGSQTRILAVTDIPDDVTETNNPIIVNGKKYGKRQFLDRYFSLIQEDFNQGIEEAKRALGFTGKNGNKKLSDLLINSLVKDDKYSYQLYQIFEEIGRTGTYNAAIGDPTIADKVYSSIFSLIKKKVNSEDTLGGPIVQVSNFGLDDSLKIHDADGNEAGSKGFDARKGFVCDCYITAPSEEVEEKITYSKENHKKLYIHGPLTRKYKEGEILSIEDIKNQKLLTEEELEFIAYRIPTEDKYSIYRMRVAGFLSRTAGETIIMPSEIVPLSGTDFDIDKMYVMWRYNLRKVKRDLRSAKEKMSEIKKEAAAQGLTGEALNDYITKQMFEKMNSRERDAYSQMRKNEIFDMQWGILGHSSSVEKQLNPGNFEPLKQLAADVDPNYKTGDDSLMYVHNQVEMHRKNAAGKDFVGIAALNNVSHGISSFADLSFKDFGFDFKINGVTKKDLKNKDGDIVFDTVTSRFDGSRISRTLGMFVGASADNAKEAVLGSVNITPTTANIAMALFRIGVPLSTVVYMMSHPLVKAAAQSAENMGAEGRFEKELKVALNSIRRSKKLTPNTLDSICKTTNITDEELRRKAREGIDEDYDNVDIATLAFLNNIIPYAEAIADLNIITSLNSTKNSVGPDVYTTIQKEYKIRRVLDKNMQGNPLFSDSIYQLTNRVPFLKPLIACYTDLLPKICKSFSPLYQTSFRQILDTLGASGRIKIDNLDDKSMKRLLNFYLLYRMSQLGIIDTTYQGRKNLIYSFPISFWQDQRNYLKDNELVQNIRIGELSKQTPLQALKINLAGVGRERTDDLTANWDALLDSEATAKISDNLLAYMLTHFGFTWNPTSATGLASTAAKQHFGKGRYQDIFVDDELWPDFEVTKFINQYARNNPKSALWVKSINYSVEEGDGILTTDAVGIPEGIVGMNHKGKLYVEVYSTDPNKRVFVSVSKLGVQSKRGTPVFFELDANADFDSSKGLGNKKLVTVISKQNNALQKEKMRIADKALLENEYEEEEDEDGEEGYTSDNPAMEQAKKLVDTFGTVYPEVYSKISAEAVDNILTDDDSAYISFLKEVVDVLSANRKLKTTYKSLLDEIKEILKTLCS